MNKILPFIILALASCADETNQKPSVSEKENVQTEVSDQSDFDQNTVKTEEPVDNTEQAKKWLEKAISEYFKQDFPDWSFMTTKEYDDYKVDMINSVYSHGVELDSLKKKWSYKYEVTNERTGVGFLIGAQDFSNIIIKSCTALTPTEKDEYLFKVILCDTDYEGCYESDITVIEYNGSFAIDNVKEYYR